MQAKQRTAYHDEIYRTYVTEALRYISENVAKGLRVDGAMYITKSLFDLVYPRPTENAETIIERIKNGLGEFGNGSV